MDDDFDALGESDFEILYTDPSGNNFEVEYPSWYKEEIDEWLRFI